MSITVIETEVTLYGKISDPSSLMEAPEIENHIQVENTFITGARERVRKITVIKGPGLGGGDKYEKTLKDKRANDAGVPSAFETTEDTDRNAYDAFTEAAQRASVKRRYTFVGNTPAVSGVEQTVILPAVRYEVDQFINPKTNQPSEWCKIDIELTDIINALKEQGIDTAGLKQRFDLTSIPVGLTEVFSSEDATPEQKALLDKLWTEEFTVPLREEVYTKNAKPTT